MINNSYLKLLRIPNVFTIPSNIILGYLIAITSFGIYDVTFDGLFTLTLLIGISILLYLGGLVSNDYFDEKIDQKERPERPIPSGNIPKKFALFIIFIFFLSASILSLLVSIGSFLVANLLIVCILVYNHKIKFSNLRSLLMGSIRGINVFYGSSFIILPSIVMNFKWTNTYDPSYSNSQTEFLITMIIVCFTIFLHVSLLTLVSSKETNTERISGKYDISINKISIIYLAYLGLLGLVGSMFFQKDGDFLIYIILYFFTICIIFYITYKKSINSIIASKQFFVKSFIMMIILLDSTLIAGIAGILPAIFTSALIIPSFILSKKINMT